MAAAYDAMRSADPATSDISRRAALRSATRELHASLDELVTAYELLRPDHYTAFLEASAAPLVAIEAMLESANFGALLSEWPARRRTDAITRDLEQLGRVPQPLQLRRAMPTASEMFGMAYVLEGSRLGARVLYERIGRDADGRVREASTYLRAHDPGMWRSFLDTLESAAVVLNTEHMIDGARYAFALFRHSFARKLPSDAAIEVSDGIF